MRSLLLVLALVGIGCGRESVSTSQREGSAKQPQTRKLFPNGQRNWVSIVESRNKPGIAIVLVEKAGTTTDGKFYLLNPDHPRDLSKGKSYSVYKLTQEANTITGSVFGIGGTVRPTRNLTQQDKTITGGGIGIAGPVATDTNVVHLRIVLKEEFDGGSVKAELHGMNENEKESIVFVRDSPTLPQQAVMLQKAEEYANEHNLTLCQHQEPPILPLEGNWFRVRLSIGPEPRDAYNHQLLVSTDGRVVDGMQKGEVMKLLGELLPNLQTDADYQHYMEEYFLASGFDQRRVVFRPSDIPAYEKHPLDKDFAEVIRPAFRIGEKDSEFYVFYTYDRPGGVVLRWKCKFYKGFLQHADSTTLGTDIGDAIFYE